jgi:hypothetical protein
LGCLHPLEFNKTFLKKVNFSSPYLPNWPFNGGVSILIGGLFLKGNISVYLFYFKYKFVFDLKHTKKIQEKRYEKWMR